MKKKRIIDLSFVKYGWVAICIFASTLSDLSALDIWNGGTSADQIPPQIDYLASQDGRNWTSRSGFYELRGAINTKTIPSIPNDINMVVDTPSVLSGTGKNRIFGIYSSSALIDGDIDGKINIDVGVPGVDEAYGIYMASRPINGDINGNITVSGASTSYGIRSSTLVDQTYKMCGNMDVFGITSAYGVILFDVMPGSEGNLNFIISSNNVSISSRTSTGLGYALYSEGVNSDMQISTNNAGYSVTFVGNMYSASGISVSGDGNAENAGSIFNLTSDNWTAESGDITIKDSSKLIFEKSAVLSASGKVIFTEDASAALYINESNYTNISIDGGNLDVSDGLNIDLMLSNESFLEGREFVLVSDIGTIVGSLDSFDVTVNGGALDRQKYEIVLLPNGINTDLILRGIVPEPAEIASLLGLVALGFIIYRKRR